MVLFQCGPSFKNTYKSLNLQQKLGVLAGYFYKRYLPTKEQVFTIQLIYIWFLYYKTRKRIHDNTKLNNYTMFTSSRIGNVLIIICCQTSWNLQLNYLKKMYPELRILLLWISRSMFDLDLFFDLKINLIFFRYPRGYLVQSGVDGSFDLGRNMYSFYRL